MEASFDFAVEVTKPTRQGFIDMRNLTDAVAKNITKAVQAHQKFVRGEVVARAHRLKSITLQKKLNDLSQQHNKAMGEKVDVYKMLDNVLSSMKGWLIAAAGIYGIKQAMDALIDSGEHLDSMLSKSRIAFGGYTNALRGYKKFQDGVARGNLFGTAEEFMDGASILMRKGVKMTDDMTNTLNNWAAGSGQSITETASAIESAISGNMAAFENFGITEREMSRHFSKFQGDTVMMRDAILSYVAAQKQFDGAAKNAPLTWKNISQRVGAMASQFKEAIIGHANDPNSLNALMKKQVTEILDYFNKHKETFRRLAVLISAVLKWIFKQVGSFAKWITKQVVGAVSHMQILMDNYRQRIAGLLLFLEMVKQKVLAFLREYKDVILFALKLLIGFKIARKVFDIGKGAYMSLVRYRLELLRLYHAMRGSQVATMVSNGISKIGTSLMRFLPFLRKATMATRLFNITLLANPIGLIVIAIAALVLWIGYLITHWNEVRASMQETNDTVLMLTAAIMPLVGLPLILAKHWEKFKAIFTNVMNTIYNVGMLAWLKLKSAVLGIIDGIATAWQKVTTWFSETFTLPDWLVDFGGYLYDSLVRMGTAIKDFFIGLMPDWFNGLGDILDKLSGGTKAVADYTATALNDEQVRQGLEKSGKSGIVAKAEKSTIDWKQVEKSKKQSLEDKISSPFDNVTPSSSTAGEMASQTVLQPGAITINIPNAVDPKQVAIEVEKVLKKMQGNNSLKGVN